MLLLVGVVDIDLLVGFHDFDGLLLRFFRLDLLIELVSLNLRQVDL